MVQYPDCPYCGNQALSVVEVEIDGVLLKGIQCNNPECKRYVGFFRDYNKVFEHINNSIENIENHISDLEN